MKESFLMLTRNLVLWIGLFCVVNLNAQELKVFYGLTSDGQGSTSVIDESGNGFDGTLLNGAVISTYDGNPVIDLGASNGYVDLGSSFGSVVTSLGNYSLMIKMFIPSTSDISGNGNFVWSFSNSNDIASDANGCLFFSAKNGRYAISPTHYAQESGIQTGSQITKDVWKVIIYVQEDGIGKLYIDGILAAWGNISLTPSELGETAYNYLGRSCYSSDAYLKDAKLAEFRVYDAPLSNGQIEELSGISTEYYGVSVLAKYDFNSLQDTSGNYVGTVNNGAELLDYNGHNILSLGSADGYFDFGADFGTIVSQLDSFSISTNMMLHNSADLSGNGNFVWNFANSTDILSTANGIIFFSAGTSKYSISKTDYNEDSEVVFGGQLPKGRWVNLTYTQRNGDGRIYIDGNLVTYSTVTINPKELGSTAYNFLGRSSYNGDKYLETAQFDNFIVYEGALNKSDILTLCEGLETLNDVLDSISLVEAKEFLTIPNADFVRSNLILNSSLGDGVTVTWETSNANVVSAKGLVSRPSVGSNPVTVVLTATLRYNNATVTKAIEVTVLPLFSDAESLQSDLDNLSITGNTDNIRSAIHLPISTLEGSQIVWTSDSPEYLNNIGKVVQLSPLGSGKKKVVLTATLMKGEENASRTFEVWVAEEEDRSSYLFSYFTGNSEVEEQIRFAVSNDGFNYTPLNNGQPIIGSDTISIKNGVRDPHILRGEDGKTFYMVVTDMKSSEGWSSNRGMVLLKSNDLVTWTHSTVHFPTKWPTIWGNVLRVWAPQTIFDPVAEKYMVYFSLYTGDTTCPYDRVYYCYANDDFTDLLGEPKILFDRGTATIDGDIVFNEAEDLYYMFFKNEALGGISQVTSSTLTEEVGNEPGSQWSTPTLPLQQTNEAVEGSGVFRLINSDQWVLMYDCYGSGHYQYCISPDLKTFKFVKNNYDINARHGTTISISDDEVARLLAKWPSDALSAKPQGARNKRIRHNGCKIDHTTKKVKIAVTNGTDLVNFNPELYASPGTVITPEGAQDFSEGAISYHLVQNDSTETYSVSVDIEGNPVISDFHADPEVLYSEKTGRFYIYPTTDGYPGWGGYSFDVFSSPDLVNWTNEGTMLDLSTDQVSWATGNAWAPCIVEKKVNDSYMYFFYFSGNAGIKKIGVAVANNPSGPYIDSGEPLLSELPSGVYGGQLIDGDVFVDSVSGKSYLYWGNGYLAVAELNDDMVSIKPNTTKVLTPSGGTLSTYAFREGVYVFYRNGLYYFLWSVDDTGAANYHVAYGTSTSPTGPIEVASQPIVIIQDAENEIYGTGHNSIVKIPGKDEWYIVYHRINADYISSDPGTHREVCIDRLNFNEDGTIIQVTPTRRGIDPVVIEKKSPPTTTSIRENSSKSDLLMGAKLKRRDIFNLSGVRVEGDINNLEYGIYIVRDVYDNGYIDARKYLVI